MVGGLAGVFFLFGSFTKMGKFREKCFLHPISLNSFISGVRCLPCILMSWTAQASGPFAWVGMNFVDWSCKVWLLWPWEKERLRPPSQELTYSTGMKLSGNHGWNVLVRVLCRVPGKGCKYRCLDARLAVWYL